MTSATAFDRLYRFGYSDEEAAFISLVAEHGGHFVTRQWEEYAHCAPGAATVNFARKLVQNGHARISTHRHNTHLIHLFSRPLYAALGREEDRNRRRRPAYQIKPKLMSVGYVLRHRDRVFLDGEQDKLRYFGDQLRIPTDRLPVRAFVSTSGRIVERYFVDRFPIAVSQSGLDLPVAFSFIDPGTVGKTTFAEHLEKYRRLFSALPEIEFSYVSTGAAPSWVRPVFTDFCNSRSSRLGVSDVSAQELLRHFQLRKLYDAEEYQQLSPQDLSDLRASLHRFQSQNFEQLYKTWLDRGDLAVMDHLAAEQSPEGSQPIRADLAFCILPQNYDFFLHTKPVR